jgi:ligand-binding sensor domain-containing protein
MTRIFIFFSILFYSFSITAQDVPIGGWKEHLSYKNALSVAEGNGKVYCATVSGIFSLNKADNSMDRLSKVTGLSDIEASVLNFNKYNNKLLIAYKNANIDIVSAGTISNISDLKRKTIIGNKSINNIWFEGDLAYLACGFGIVVVDMDKMEIKDTYYIEQSGNALNVTDITTLNSMFYVSTAAGIYTASMTNQNLSNFASWTRMPLSGLPFPTGVYNTIAAYNGKIYANYSKNLTNGTEEADSVYVYDPGNNSWNNLSLFPGSKETINLIRVSNNELVFAMDKHVITLSGGNWGGYFNDYYSKARSAVIDNSGVLWIADNKYGLIQKAPAGTYTAIHPNGPNSAKVFNMDLSDGNLWVAPGGTETFYTDGPYIYSGSEWKSPRGFSAPVNMDSIYDIVEVLIDPKNSSKAYISSYAKGVIEFTDGVPVIVYNESNSTIRPLNVTNYNQRWVYGLALDESGSLWVSNSMGDDPDFLAIKDVSGNWTKVSFQGVFSKKRLGKILIDKNNQKWIPATKGGGLIVYKGGPTDNAVLGTNTLVLTPAAGNGHLPSEDVFAIVEDKDGEIWIGTNKGIGVFYNPENMFGGGNYDAQQILLEQDGHIQILLETETVQAIAVDDANRKWIGTAKSGVFLMSADGTEELQHFDVDNSPLFSNNIKSIEIDHKTGEIYIGTDKGIISYRGTAISGEECFKDVYSFPNPVKPGYSGPIAIRGLMDNTTVKITDISGTLVYETVSEGGQALWYGNNFKGDRVSSGVYMVFCTSEDANCQKVATKILLVN